MKYIYEGKIIGECVAESMINGVKYLSIQVGQTIYLAPAEKCDEWIEEE